MLYEVITLPDIRDTLGSMRSPLLVRIREGLGDHRAFVEQVTGAMRREAPAGYRDGGIFREGYDARMSYNFV